VPGQGTAVTNSKDRGVDDIYAVACNYDCALCMLANYSVLASNLSSNMPCTTFFHQTNQLAVGCKQVRQLWKFLERH